MEINGWLVEHYLGYITVGWFNKDDLPPEKVEEYTPYVLDMKSEAISHGDLETLRLAFDHILGNPQIDSSEFGRTRYPFDDADVREIIGFARSVICPDAESVPPGGPPKVNIIRTSFSEWTASRSRKQ